MEFVVYAAMVVGVVWGAARFLRRAYAKPKIDKNWEVKFWSDFYRWNDRV